MKTTNITLVLLSVMLFAAIAAIMAKDAATSDVCGVSQADLFECKPAVATGTATPPLPTDACCGAVKHANLTCFCTFKTNKYLPLFGINVTRAMQLPTTCDSSVSALKC